MSKEGLHHRLSQISTVWTVLRQAHDGSREAATSAQQLLMRRYRGAVYRYLLKAVGDPGAADDLTQEFAVSLVRGDFRHVDPQKGRFRNYVKTVLFHLVSRFRKAQQKLPKPMSSTSPEWEALATTDSPDAQFDDNWRAEVLALTWEALSKDHPTFFAVLKLRADEPELSSVDMARQISTQVGKSMTADTIRQTLRRARARFGALLLDEVAQSLDSPTPEEVVEELGALNLHKYCAAALAEYQRSRDSC